MAWGLRLAGVVLSLSVAFPPSASAKTNCRKVCHSAISACQSTVKSQLGCKSLKGSARGECNKTQRVKLKACKDGALKACTASAGATCS